MAAARKLQDEIQRCLKEVNKGVEKFDDIYEKFYDPENSKQKQTYEALAKKIKKLQKLRDQIITWISSPKIKDGQELLIGHRDLLNIRMERFNEAKKKITTGKFSNKALSSVPKPDPAQKEKEDISAWLNQSIKSLNFQIDQYEHQMSKPPVDNKILMIKNTQNMRDELKSRIQRHGVHIEQLETLLRMLNNMSIKPKKIITIKRKIENYIKNSHKEKFKQADDFYDKIIEDSTEIKKRNRDRCK